MSDICAKCGNPRAHDLHEIVAGGFPAPHAHYFVQSEPRKTLSDGTQIYPSHREIDPKTGQQRGYVVLAEEERAKGFVRPVRRTYVHLKCGAPTTMGLTIAETYARDPYFYSGTFCVTCGAHFPVGANGEFVWAGTDERVGT